MKKTLLTAIVAATLLSSCSVSEDNQNIHEGGKFVLSDVSQAYAGSGGLCGKEYKNFKMPSEIAVKELSEVYELDCNIVKAQEPYDNIMESYKAFYGAAFNESCVGSDEHGGLLYTDGNASASYWGMDMTLMSGDFSTDDLKTCYIADLSAEQIISLGGNEVKVSEFCQNTENSLTGILSGFYKDYRIEVKSISTYETGEGADFICGLCYKGVPFQYKLSNYFSADGMGDNSYWAAFRLFGSVDSRNNITYINASAPYNITDKRQIESLISLCEAVNILDNNLSEQSFYEFSNVELTYCCLTKQPDIDYTDSENAAEAEKLTEEYNLEAKTFEPYWCFEINQGTASSGTEYIKINAVTGEIFMDID